MLIGFFRNKKTKLYLTVFSIILTFLIIIFCFKNYFLSIKNEIFSDNSIIIINSKRDYEKDFLHNNNILNYERAAILNPDYNCETIIRGDYVVATPEGQVLDSYKSNSSEKKITWDLLKITGNNYILVFESPLSKKIDNNQIILNIDKNFYDYYSDIFDNTVNKEIDLKFHDDTKISFIIHDIESEKWANVSVNKEIFEKILKRQNNYTYILKFKTESGANKFKNEYDKIRDVNVKIETSYEEKDSRYFEKLNKILSVLTFILYFFIATFLFVIMIIFKNITLDLKNKNRILMNLGYKKQLIKFLTFSKIILVYLLSIITSVLLSFIISKIINYFFNLKLIFIDYKNLILLLCIGFVLDCWISIRKKSYY